MKHRHDGQVTVYGLLVDGRITAAVNPRTIAIGDIHGCSAALDALLEAIRPRPEDCIVTLGDYINRGPDSRGVIERLIELKDRCRLVPLLGNHEEMLFEALADSYPLD